MELQTVKGSVLNKIKEHRDEYLSIFNQSQEDRQRLEKFKNDKIFSDSENQKLIIKSMDQKLRAQTEFQQQTEQELKKYIEVKFINLLEQLKNDQKLALEREKRTNEYVQEGLVTMNDIIKGTKEQNLISLSH